jgi:Leucine-rich repeat (LRR) protein
MTTLADKDWWVMESESIDESFFENRRIKNLLMHIGKLEISDNLLKELGFLAKNELTYLNVSGNQIAAIDLRDFDFSGLKFLNISKNLIQVIKLYDCDLGKLETFQACINS